jgi:tripartite-type tricarboxylate transporter receptor subunit TctC
VVGVPVACRFRQGRQGEAPCHQRRAALAAGFDFAPIGGVLAPAGTPKGIIDKMASDIAATTKMPETQKALAASGIETVGGGSNEYAKAIVSENARMAKAIDAAGIKPE